MGRQLPRRVWAGLLPLLIAAAGEAAPTVRQILVLQSFDRANVSLVTDRFTPAFRTSMARDGAEPVNILEVNVNPFGLAATSDEAVLAFLTSGFDRRQKPELLVAVGGTAVTFARRYRQTLFPGTPIIFTAVDERFLRDAPLAADETAVTAVNDPPGFVEGILQLLPRTRNLVLITGAGPQGRFWHQELGRELQRFKSRVTLDWTDDLSFTEILQRAATLAPDSAIFFFVFGTDARGIGYTDEQTLTRLHAVANAPLFAVPAPALGLGVVGGVMLSVDDMGRRTADAAIRILAGESPGRIRTPPQLPGPPIFDWRELQRWRISESRLPPGSIVHHRSPPLWREYRRTVVSAVGALIIQSLLIVGLLYQRRARQRAEIESRRNLALAADASRRETMSALTSSIAHQLGQPLSAMIHNAQALQMMIDADRVPLDTIGEIVSDIRSQGVQATQIIDRHRTMLRTRQLEKTPIDLHAVLSESLALVAPEMRARQIQTTVTLSSNPCVISGDHVLLQQVLVNLLMNAMDAMADTPPDRRRVTITTRVRADNVEVSVHDTGTGLPAEIDGTLFTPFASTKAHGLGIGLTIAQTIVEAHGGSIEAHNNPEGGATFTVRLRRTETTSSLSGQ